MARKAGRPKAGRVDTTVKIDTRLIQKARVVAGHRNVPLNQLLSDMLEGPINAATAEVLRELSTPADQPAADDAPARPSRRKPKAP